jgi:lysophospholipase L1-like esterase
LSDQFIDSSTILDRMRTLHLLFIVLLSSCLVYGQVTKPPFYDEVQKIKKADSLNTQIGPSILFIGSSSFTMWKDIKEYFPGKSIINHGFGGSTLPDLIHYIHDIVPSKKIKQVVIYCGENDLASSDSVTATKVLERFRILFTILRKKIKDVPIVYVSMKPSPSRQLILGKIREGNRLIRQYLKSKRKTAFADVYSEMIDDEGKPRAEIFLNDNLHMNKQGYAIWQKILEPYLLK